MRGVEFEVDWSDNDLIQYRVTCSNGRFRGETRMYLDHGALGELAESLRGFPSSSKDSRDIELGAPDAKFAGGGILMAFRCVDSVGHAVAIVRLRTDGCKGPGEPESVCLYIPVEAGAIDAFVDQAATIDETLGATAYLQMADHTVEQIQRKFPELANLPVSY